MKTLIRGFLCGAAFFLIGSYVYQNNQQKFQAYLYGAAELPIIEDFSKDFQTGAQLLGKQFGAYVQNFDMKAPFQVNNILNKKNNIQWNRSDIERKVAHFRSSKKKQSIAYLNYIEQYAGLAAAEMARTQIPASVTLAQGLLETNAGDSRIAKVANNHFGIKCRKYPNYKADGQIDQRDFYHAELAYDCLQIHDDNVWDRFNMYASPAESYRHHSVLLTESSRYNWMIRQYWDDVGQYCQVEPHWFGTETVPYYTAWCIGLKKSGYATGSRYAQKLAYIIQTYELWLFDYQVIISQLH